MKLLKSPSRPALALSLGAIGLIATTIFAQQFATARADEGTTARLVTNLIEKYHISQPRIDDAASTKLVDVVLKDLDPQKLYLTAQDVAYVQQYAKVLDDQLRAGKVDFIFTIFKIYEKRVAERIELAHKLVDVTHDFTIDESIVTEPDDLAWPKTGQEITERWRKRVKADLLDKLLEDVELAQAKEDLHKRYRMVGNMVSQTEEHEKLEIYLTALAKTLDPHSSYMSEQTLEDFRIQMRLSLDGIGAALRAEDGYTTVAKVVPGGAAEADGRLQVGDVILAVGQEEGEMVDVVEMKLSKVVRFIRGKRGTIVRLKVKNADGQVSVYSLKRQKVELEEDAVRGKIIQTNQRLGNGKNMRIGVINIPSFYRDFQGAQLQKKDFKSTSRDVRKVLGSFEAQGGVDGVLIDLRWNGGGALAEAIEVSGLFIDQGPVVQVKNLDGSVRAHNDDDPGVAYNGPLVVAINKLSASASEIFAGVIKDYGRGVIVGDESTHGKGTVQNVMPVSDRVYQFFPSKDLGALKLTINQFYRVNGDSTQNHGVRSDVVLPSKLDHMDLGEASLDNALAFDRIQPAPHVSVNMVSQQVLGRLQAASRQRIAASDDFQEDLQGINRFLERKNRKKMSLNLATRKAERDAEKSLADQEKDEEDLDKKDIFPEGHYNDELLNITRDYIGALPGSSIAAGSR